MTSLKSPLKPKNSDLNPFVTKNWNKAYDWTVNSEAGLTFVPEVEEITTLEGNLDTNTTESGSWVVAQ